METENEQPQKRHPEKSWADIFILLTIVLLIRFIPGGGEWYARNIYPYISAFLSYVSSFVTFSLDEIVVIIGIVSLLFPLLGLILGGKGFLTFLRREIRILLIFYIWFYIGWGSNYFRDSIYTRMEIAPVEADSLRFQQFLHHFTDSLNLTFDSSFVAMQRAEVDQENTMKEIKHQYSLLPKSYGLCTPRDYQKPKEVTFNKLYSGVGTLGYMGPFFCESQLNHDLLACQYPFVFAHEYSHLLGISNEAEANFWAYETCRKCPETYIRFCGYYGILGYVLNSAWSMLSVQDYEALRASIDPRILQMLHDQQQFWLSQREPLWERWQNRLYEAFLKGNNIPEGRKSYSGVVALIIAHYREPACQPAE